MDELMYDMKYRTVNTFLNLISDKKEYKLYLDKTMLDFRRLVVCVTSKSSMVRAELSFDVKKTFFLNHQNSSNWLVDGPTNSGS